MTCPQRRTSPLIPLRPRRGTVQHGSSKLGESNLFNHMDPKYDGYARAKVLKESSTPAEQAMWKIVRDKRIGGYKFRRQHPFYRFILDFYCKEKLLAIEVDGSVHNRANGKAYDQERERILNNQGIQVIRFSNSEVLHNPFQVAQSILKTLHVALPLSASGEGFGVRFLK